VPQWNCRCPNCEAARTDATIVRPRTQSSLAVSADGRRWFLLNVSPDIRQQMIAFPALGPPDGQTRGQSIAGCVLTDAELDHSAGLLLLREGTSFDVFSTVLVRRWLNRHFPVEPLLASFARPRWNDLPLDEPLNLTEDLIVRAFEVDRHVPRFVTDASGEAIGSVIGLQVHDAKTGGTLAYAPCLGSLREPLLSLGSAVEALFVDGTFWSDEEPLAFGTRTATQMGHLPVSGANGSLAWLSTLPVHHRVYVHINNTNAMLNERGAERREVSASGVRVGADGDVFEL
jgi:pyrroloquinoline quinone biosynthesis protein B